MSRWTEPGGKPAKSAEIAFAAVDEALLQLKPNESWKLIDAMMGERPISVLTSTAQMQVVGKADIWQESGNQRRWRRWRPSERDAR